MEQVEKRKPDQAMVQKPRQGEKKNPVQSAERIFHILEILVKKGGTGPTELGKLTGLNKSTVHRLLSSLVCMGYIRRDEEAQKYYPTYKIVGMANQVLEKVEILPIIHGVVQELALLCQETVHVVQRVENNVVYIDKVEAGNRSVRMISRIGAIMPMYCTAVGKAIMAALPEEEAKQIWESSDIAKRTGHTITDCGRMRGELREIRKNGYALDNEENEEGVKCIGAAILDWPRKAQYAFSISVPSARMTEQNLSVWKERILEAREKINRLLS